jgi:hypothetical protein
VLFTNEYKSSTEFVMGPVSTPDDGCLVDNSGVAGSEVDANKIKGVTVRAPSRAMQDRSPYQEWSELAWNPIPWVLVPVVLPPDSFAINW